MLISQYGRGMQNYIRKFNWSTVYHCNWPCTPAQVFSVTEADSSSACGAMLDLHAVTQGYKQIRMMNVHAVQPWQLQENKRVRSQMVCTRPYSHEDTVILGFCSTTLVPARDVRSWLWSWGINNVVQVDF